MAHEVFQPTATHANGAWLNDVDAVVYGLMSPAQQAQSKLATLATDANGNALGINGPNGIIPLDSKLPNNTLAMLGTSVEALFATLDTYLGVTSDASYSARGDITLANVVLSFPFSEIDNFGVGGDTSGPSTGHPGMTSRVASVIAGGYGWCYVGFPINDIENGAGLDPTNFTLVNMYSIYSQLLGAGIKVIASLGSAFGTPYGVDVSAAGAGNDVARQNLSIVQNGIKNYVASHAGIVLYDGYNPMINPATGVLITSPLSTVDGLHPSNYGSGLRAQALVEVLQPLVKLQNTSISNQYDPKNYAGNPMGLVTAPINATAITTGRIYIIASLGTSTWATFSNSGASPAVGQFITSSGNGNGTGTAYDLYANNSRVGGTGASGFVPDGWSINGIGGGSQTAVGSFTTNRAANTWRQPQAGARIALAASATWDGANFTVNDAVKGIGYFSLLVTGFSNSLAYGRGTRVAGTGSTLGYSYLNVKQGTAPNATPPWGTTEGALVVDAGGGLWLTQKQPTVGDKFYAEVEIETSALTAGKGGTVALYLHASNTAGVIQQVVTCNSVTFDTTIPPRYLPATMRLRTPTMTLGSWATTGNLKGITAVIQPCGEAGASFNTDVYRVDIIRAT